MLISAFYAKKTKKKKNKWTETCFSSSQYCNQQSVAITTWREKCTPRVCVEYLSTDVTDLVLIKYETEERSSSPQCICCPCGVCVVPVPCLCVQSLQSAPEPLHSYDPVRSDTVPHHLWHKNTTHKLVTWALELPLKLKELANQHPYGLAGIWINPTL